ncbi:hypothetical protein M758_5G088200, partial [Ceratodon purpureus]
GRCTGAVATRHAIDQLLQCRQRKQMPINDHLFHGDDIAPYLWPLQAGGEQRMIKLACCHPADIIVAMVQTEFCLFGTDCSIHGGNQE